MKHGRIGNGSALREAAQIRTLISDLDRIVQFLNFDIATEEKHAEVFDRADVAYSLLAGMLAARRDNLVDTIAAIEVRLAAIKTSLFDLSPPNGSSSELPKPSQAAFARSPAL
jgi:septation ring formation regulator EzrA